MAADVGTGMPAFPEAFSPEEVALGAKIVTPRVERESVQDFPPPKMTDQLLLLLKRQLRSCIFHSLSLLLINLRML